MRESGFMYIVGLSIRNAIRWRWRLLLVVLMICLTNTMYIFYCGISESAFVSGMASIIPLDIKYYDMLLLLTESQSVVPPENLPKEQNNLQDQEATLLLTCSTMYGDFKIIGLQAESPFFDISSADLIGRLPENGQELALPHSWIEHGFSVGSYLEVSYCGQEGAITFAFEIVGFYTADDYPLALAPYGTLRRFLPEAEANAILMAVDSELVNLSYFSEWLFNIYPGATQISRYLPQQLGKSMLEQSTDLGPFVPFMLCSFLCVGIITVNLMTFFERRKEFSSLKACGVSGVQLILLLVLEAMPPYAAGLLMTGVSVYACMEYTHILDALSISQIHWNILSAGVLSTLAVFAGLIYPVMVIRKATVHHLLFSRTIPILERWIDHMDLLKSKKEYMVREVMDEVRLLHIPFSLSEYRYECIVFKTTKQHVKKGEIIATQILFSGHVIRNFCSPCDGSIIEMLNALIVIKPDDPRNTPFYPYRNRPYIDPVEIAKKREQDRLMVKFY